MTAIVLGQELLRCPIRIAAVLHVQTANQAGEITVLPFGLDVARMPLILQASK